MFRWTILIGLAAWIITVGKLSLVFLAHTFSFDAVLQFCTLLFTLGSRHLAVGHNCLTVHTRAFPIFTLLILVTFLIRPAGYTFAIRQLTSVLACTLLVLAYLTLRAIIVACTSRVLASRHLGLGIAADALVLGTGLQLGALLTGGGRPAVGQPVLGFLTAALPLLAHLGR